MATTWSDMLKRGCDIAWMVRIEGIPILFTERELSRVDSASDVGLPTGYTSACPALLISDQDKVEVELDRKTGIARGSEWQIMLAYNALEDAGILDDLFARPSVSSTLAAVPDAGSDSVLEYNGTTIKVADNSGFSNGQTVYLGKETITIGAVDGDGISLTSCTRGVAGYAYEFNSSSLGSYRSVSNRPGVWRGRFVELHAHLVSPEGRVIDATWMSGSYHRCMWRGYIDAPPSPDSVGMRLRALPMCRLAGNNVGHQVTAKLINSTPYTGPDVDGQKSHEWAKEAVSSLIRVVGDGTETLSVKLTYLVKTPSGSPSTHVKETALFTLPTDALGAGLHPLGSWVSEMSTDAHAFLTGTNSATTGQPICDFVQVLFTKNGLTMRVHLNPGHHTFSATTGVVSGDAQQCGIFVEPDSGCYWVQSGVTESHFVTSHHAYVHIPIQHKYPAGGWLPIEEITGEGLQDMTLPSTGLGVLSKGEAKEVIRWSAKDTSFTTSHKVTLIKISQRNVNDTPTVLAADPDVSFSALSGHTGTAADVIRTILQSSGTGARGDYDTLGLGQGLGIPEDWMDLTSLGGWQLDMMGVDAVNEGSQSLGDMIGGWLALSGLCLAQIVDIVSGGCRFAVVGTQPLFSAMAVTVSAADVLLRSVELPRVAESPNTINVDASGLHQRAPITVRDAPRIQGEGSRAWDMTCPSMERGRAISSSMVLIAMGDGQSVVRFEVGPWVEVQPGAILNLTMAHPAMFDWSTGSRSPSAVFGRVVGWGIDLFSGKQAVTCLLAGQAAESSFLAPSMIVQSKSTATLTMATAYAAAWFAADDYVRLYTPGTDASEAETQQVDSVNLALNTITLKATPSSWVGAGTVVTVAIWTSASTAQKQYMYVRSEKTWGL